MMAPSDPHYGFKDKDKDKAKDKAWMEGEQGSLSSHQKDVASIEPNE
jgi:hypothetical protein